MTMNALDNLFENNRLWAAEMQAHDPDFFQRLSQQQSPDYLWIGCSDSRVPANQIIGLLPGAVFVHRNVANVVVHTDLNCLSVIQYAVEVLQVEHIIVCGHYGCGGVQAALRDDRLGLIDNWLRHVRDAYQKHQTALSVITDERQQWDRLCELNVVEQVAHVCQTTIMQDAWARGQALTVHGLIYGLQDGRLRSLNISVSHPDDLEPAYQAAIH